MSAIIGTAAAIAKAAELAAAATAVINTGLNLMQAAQQVSGIIQVAQAQGREVTDEEMNSVILSDDAQKALLDKDIAARQAAAGITPSA